MCYVVAKDTRKRGCYALKTQHGKGLVALKKELNDRVNHAYMQIVTISRPSAYGEYAPYQIMDTEQDFIRAVESM